MQPHRTHCPSVLDPIRPGKFQAPNIPTTVLARQTTTVISARMNSRLQLPALGQELLSGGHLSQKRDPVWRETMPLNRCDLFAILRQIRIGFLALRFLLPHIGEVISGIRPGNRSTGSLLGLIELLDLRDTRGEPEGCVDLVFDIARGLVDKDRPER